jgi:hypothetical protein
LDCGGRDTAFKNTGVCAFQKRRRTPLAAAVQDGAPQIALLSLKCIIPQLPAEITVRLVGIVVVGANADCPLSLWMDWVIQRLSSQRSHSPVGVVQLWIVRLHCAMRVALIIGASVCCAIGLLNHYHLFHLKAWKKENRD